MVREGSNTSHWSLVVANPLEVVSVSGPDVYATSNLEPRSSHAKSGLEWFRLSQGVGIDPLLLKRLVLERGGHATETFAMSYRAIWGFWARNQSVSVKLVSQSPRSKQPGRESKIESQNGAFESR